VSPQEQRLERLARSGDTDAALRLERLRERRGELLIPATDATAWSEAPMIENGLGGYGWKYPKGDGDSLCLLNGWGGGVSGRGESDDGDGFGDGVTGSGCGDGVEGLSFGPGDGSG
jgi:hypothetical protein